MLFRSQLRLFQEKEEELNQAYHTKMEELEPLFIEKITGIYEHIFHIDLSPYRDMVIYLLSNTIRNIENSRDFIIHLSKEDYPFVLMQKTQIISSLSANVTVEMIEDITLATGECYIETLGGIFDCGIDSQLQELGKELKLLSYE